MLRINKHIHPKHGARRVFPPLKKLKDGFQSVGNGVAPRVADEPRRRCHVMRSGCVRGKLIRHAAPPPRRSGPQVHLLELRRRHAAKRRAKLPVYPAQVLQRDALQQQTSAKAQGQLLQRDSPERRSLHLLPQRQALDAARGRSRRKQRILRSCLPRCTPATRTHAAAASTRGTRGT
jgi:hypothetical protein